MESSSILKNIYFTFFKVLLYSKIITLIFHLYRTVLPY